MFGLLTIGLRNVFSDRRRSILIGLSLFISCTLLLLADAVGNGSGTQLLRRHRAVQSADVVAVWRNVLEDVDPEDPGRILFSEPDGKTGDENLAAIRRLDAFLLRNAAEVSVVYRPIRGFGMLDTGNVASSMMLYGLSPEELRHLEKEKALALIDGGPLFDSEYGAYVSADTADKNGIWVGDYITLDAATAAGLMNTMDFQIQGVYANGAPWDNIAVYVREQDARALMEWDPALFSSARIYLKDPGKRAELARELDGYLREAGGVLRAEPSDVSLRFWSALAGLLKGIFTFFVVFLLLVIALGIRSTIRMNLFQRIQEFGTLRAIGFTRPQAFLVIFTEIFTISLLALASAAGFSTLLVAILSRTGIYLGSGAAAYALGSEYVYPALTALDLVTALAIVTGFSLLSPLRPGLKLCYQKIIDMLARRQRRVSVFGSLIRRRSQGGPL